MARSELLWLDSDVLLDWLANRQPWDTAARELMRRGANGDWALWFSPLTLANVHYVYRKQAGAAKAIAAISALVQIGNVAAMDATHVKQAISSGHSDFEDEMQIASASNVPDLSAIITRNLSDYAHSTVPAMTAAFWLQQHP
jgi:predicted nucleic acid-binding protein